MGRVELRFPPIPGHVRTARLVAVAVARRSRLDDVRLDEVRLAVGEACVRAVRRCEKCATGDMVLMRISDGPTGLLVEVIDWSNTDEEDEPVALALLKGLADSVELESGPAGPGGRIRLSWVTPYSPSGVIGL
jgi:anti-sigma regulatory factor (Ser/Thr protein kinase)